MHSILRIDRWTLQIQLVLRMCCGSSNELPVGAPDYCYFGRHQLTLSNYFLPITLRSCLLKQNFRVVHSTFRMPHERSVCQYFPLLPFGFCFE
jgi:hypothetical protein